MAPCNPDTKKRKKAATTVTPSAAQRGVVVSGRSQRQHDSTDKEEDGLSSLPESILGCILTLLSATEAARMSRHSRTWRSVYSSADYQLVSLDDNDLWRGRHRPRRDTLSNYKLSEWRCNVITALLGKHHASIRRFVVRQTRMAVGEPETMVSTWLDTLSDAGVVEELVLAVPSSVRGPLVLSRSLIFKCSSLRSLTLSNCRWQTPPPTPRTTNNNGNTIVDDPVWTLPHLTELTLTGWAHDLHMTVEDVEDLLRRCPALLSLSMGRMSSRCWLAGDDRHLEIRSQNLRSITKVGRWQHMFHLVEAPNLERLLWWPLLSPYVKLDKSLPPPTPRLQTLGIFRSCPVMEGDVWEQVRVVALVTNVDDVPDLDQAFKTLHHFPQLETLHMKMTDGSESDKSKQINFEELAGGGPILCLENTVKKIVLRVNNLVRQKLAFANFLLREAKSLRSMFIYKMRIAGELLPPEKRGSSIAEVVFGDSSKCSLEMMDTSAANYKLDDPFML